MTAQLAHPREADAAERVAIEQAIARGEPHDEIAARLHIPVEDVDHVRRRLDQINASTPHGHGHGPVPHGTYYGYQRHRLEHTEPCRPCRDARAAYKRAWRARQRGAA